MRAIASPKTRKSSKAGLCSLLILKVVTRDLKFVTIRIQHVRWYGENVGLMPRMSAPLSPDSPLSPAFSSLPWAELEECGAASRAWCRVERLPHGSFGLALNACNVLTQKPTNPQCTLKQFDLVVEVNAEPLKGRLCDELNEGDRAKASSVVLTVLRPTVSVDQLLRASAKLARQKGTSSTSSSPSSSRARDSAREAGTRSAPSGRRPPRAPSSSTRRELLPLYPPNPLASPRDADEEEREGSISHGRGRKESSSEGRGGDAGYDHEGGSDVRGGDRGRFGL